jgi:type IV fimbrial biogenesis protein FimT
MLNLSHPRRMGLPSMRVQTVMLKHARQAGFSLIEIAVVLVILALALMAVMPDVNATIGNARLRSSAESFTAGLARARMEAMRSNAPVTFWMMSDNGDRQLDNGCAVSPQSASWVVSVDDPTGACAQEVDSADQPQTPFIKLKHDGGAASVAMAVLGRPASGNGSASSVRFDGYGRIAGGSLRLIDINSTSPSNDIRPLRIEMTTSGVVRMCEPLITNVNDPRRCLHS